MEWAHANPNCQYFTTDGNAYIKIVEKAILGSRPNVLKWIATKLGHYDFFTFDLLKQMASGPVCLMKWLKQARPGFIFPTCINGKTITIDSKSDVCANVKEALLVTADLACNIHTLDFLLQEFGTSVEKFVTDKVLDYHILKDDIEFLIWYQSKLYLNLINTNFNRVVKLAAKHDCIRCFAWLTTNSILHLVSTFSSK